MSKLEELIEELCPDGVEYKKIKDIADVSIGEFVHKSKQNPDAEYPVFNGGTSNTGFYDEYNRTANKIIISARGANAGFVNRVFTNFWSGNSCYTIDVKDNNVDWIYLYYWLKSKELKLLGEQQKGGIPAVSKKQVEDFSCPIPPLPVQEEIVRILDKFTDLTAELQSELLSELQARAKQYEYYREIILDKNKDAEWVPLLDIADTFTGLTYKPSDVASAGTLVLRSSNIQNNRMSYEDNVYVQMDKIPDRAIVRENDILICVRNGSKALIGKAAIIPHHTEKMAFGAFMTILRAKESVDYRYLFFVWQSPRIQNMIHGDSGMPINQITKKMFEQIKVPLPSLKNQKEIITILEKFDKLSFDISEGLPAEIEARQKQYEYYRNKLLTFKELRA